jgi:CBS domain-containing protein
MPSARPKHRTPPDGRATPGRTPREALGFYGYRVKDVMTRPVVGVDADASLAEAAARMSRKGISGLPVLAKGGRLVGVLSQKDLLRVLSERAGLRVPGGILDLVLSPGSEARPDLAERCRRVLDATRVRAVMSRPARSIGPEVLLDDAVRLLVAQKINRLPVVSGRRVVGIVTRTDLLGGLSSPA